MSVHIIIDGYNFIRQSMSSRLLSSRDLQEEREIFIDSLAAYKRRKAHAITVVFDGTRAPFDLARKEVVRGIEIVFSPAGQTADTVIKQLAAGEREKALVVSSDREISDFAEARGATLFLLQILRTGFTCCRKVPAKQALRMMNMLFRRPQPGKKDRLFVFPKSSETPRKKSANCKQ